MKNIGNITISDERDRKFEEQFGEPYLQRKQLVEAGVHISPELFERTLDSATLHSRTEELVENKVTGTESIAMSVAGRIANIRHHKKSAFIDLIDTTGRIQVFVPHAKLEGTQKLIYQTLNRGDFLGVHGTPFATNTGEPTIKTEELILLGKALKMIPDIDTPLDKETQYRDRFLDLILHPETHERFVLRSKVIKTIRDFMDEHSFIEVETPVIDTLATGALAKPFGTHHNALDLDCQMRIAPEVPLKKLVIGGLERVFEIGKQFRNEGMDPEHLQEFTTLEFYEAYANYEKLMQFTEEWFLEVVTRSIGEDAFEYDGNTINLAGPWERKTFQELILASTGINIDEYPDQKALEDISEKVAGLDVSGKSNRGGTIDLLYKKTVRSDIIQPTFVLGHTADLSPLARRSDAQPEQVDRFQVVMGGVELVNAYSELVDPLDQRIRFEDQSAAKAEGDEEAHVIDHEYLHAMEHGMPPIAGWGVGIDRLIMMLTDQKNIRDTVLFPLMKPRR